MKYPLGIQTFERLREDGCVYVDKTKYIYSLASEGKFYFLSRPRRFGKSLLLTTLEAYFLGKKKLFKGLAIEGLEKDWTEYPVFYLNLASGKFHVEGTLEKTLNDTLSLWEDLYGRKGETLGLRFKNVIQFAYEKTGKQVVVLVDEYDKPLLDTITDEEMQSDLRGTLKEFYGVLKSQEKYVRFAFLTGVTKFSHISIFSDLNQLEDISIDPNYSEICGITEDELKHYFKESVEILAEKNNLTVEQCHRKLKEMYDGYHFYWPSKGVYNPFSILNTFKKNIFKEYWFATGTPTFLVELIRKGRFSLADIKEKKVSVQTLSSMEMMNSTPIPVLYQSGYLTLTNYNERFEYYNLDFPNREVDFGFNEFLLPVYTQLPSFEARDFVVNFCLDVEDGKPEKFMERVKTFFDSADYRVAGDREVYFQNSLYVLFRLCGFFTQVEYATSKGRVDVVIQTSDYVYVMELKVGVPAQEALAQIDQKDYILPFASTGHKLYKIGVSFDPETRSLTDWVIEES